MNLFFYLLIYISRPEDNLEVFWHIFSMKKIRFRGGIRELSDPAQANTARSFAGINFVIAGLSLALIENINFFMWELFQHSSTIAKNSRDTATLNRTL